MKKSVMFLAMMMVSTFIFAQRQHHDTNKGAKRSEAFRKELSLSDDQVAKMKAIRTKYAERHVLIRKDTALTQGTARNEQKKLHAEQEAEFKGVLTPEQWTKYTAMKARHSEQRKKFHKS